MPGLSGTSETIIWVSSLNRGPDRKLTWPGKAVHPCSESESECALAEPQSCFPLHHMALCACILLWCCAVPSQQHCAPRSGAISLLFEVLLLPLPWSQSSHHPLETSTVLWAQHLLSNARGHLMVLNVGFFLKYCYAGVNICNKIVF